jgi:hypothetical protein
MMKKCLVLFAVLLVLPLAGLNAQQAGSYTVFQTELGVSILPVTGGSPTGYIGFNYRLGPNFSVGIVSFNSFSLNTSFAALKYDVVPQLRLVGGVGIGGIGLLGFELIPLRQTLGSGGTLELKLLFDGIINIPFSSSGLMGGFVLALGI